MPTSFVPFKICSDTIIQTFANSVDTFMPFSAICEVQFPTPSHTLNECSLLFYYVCPTNVQYLMTISLSPLPAQFPSNLHTGSSTNAVSLSPSAVKLTVLYLHFIHLLQDSTIYRCSTEPTKKTIPVSIDCTYSHKPHNNVLRTVKELQTI